MPKDLKNIIGSPLIIGALAAIIMNFILPVNESKAEKSTALKTKDSTA